MSNFEMQDQGRLKFFPPTLRVQESIEFYVSLIFGVALYVQGEK